MNLAIEVLGIGAIISLVILFSAWKLLSQKWLKRRYKPEHDKSRLGEEKRRADSAVDARIRGIETGKNNVPRPTNAEKREPIQTADPDKVGQNLPGTRKSLGRIIFKKRRN